MKVPDSFRPDQNLDSYLNDLLSDKRNSGKTCLLILAKQIGVETTNIYFWRSSFEPPHLLKSFSFNIWSLCPFGEELYLGLYSGAILKLPYGKLVTKRDMPISTICVHEDKIYDASDTTIYETLNGDVVDVRDAPVKKLYSYGGVLYDGGLYNSVNNSLKKKKAFDGLGNAFSLFCDGNYFYVGGNYGVKNLDTHERVVRRNFSVHAMGEYDGAIYDTGASDGVFKNFSDSLLFDFPDDNGYVVMDMVEAPLRLLEKIIDP